MDKDAIQEGSQRATITDVARLAGVSVKTVSRVLNQQPKVKQATRERVEQAMRALGYRPNSPARMLAGNRTYLLGLIYNASSSYVTSLQNGVLAACRPAHYDLLIHPCRYSAPHLLEDIRDFVSGPRVDGLVLVPPVADVEGAQALLRELAIPTVSISRDPAEENDWAVCTNDREVSQEMVRYLAQLGHERIAFVRGHPHHKAMANRYEGYLAGMAAAGIEARDALLAQGDNTFNGGISCAHELLSSQSAPTAIFCANDRMAAGVLQAAHERGLAIPDALSVAGFDDAPIANQLWPRLTTVRQPIEAMAERAAQMLLRRIRGEMPERTHVIIEAELVVRRSTGPAAP